jgi:hypothetical protein
MKRTAGTILVATTEILIGLSFMLMALVMVSLLVKNPSASAPGIPSMKSMFAVVGAMYGVLGAFGIATGIGVLLAKNWARIVTLVAGAMLTFSALIAGVFTMIMPFASIPNLSEQQIHLVRVVLGSFWGFVALIGVWWIVFMTRSRIVALFKNQQGEVAGESPRPLSITVIGGLFVCFAVLGGGFQLAFRTPFVLFGHVVQGVPGVLMNLLLAIIYIVLGLGLLRLDRRAYLGTLGLLGYGALNALLMSVLPDRMERLQRVLKASPGYNPSQFSQAQWIFSPWYTLFICVITLGLPAYFLITRRAVFYRAPTVETTETLVV